MLSFAQLDDIVSHDFEDMPNSIRLQKALAVAGEFRSVLRYAIDAMPKQLEPFTSDAILGYVLQSITASVHGAFEAILLLCSKGWGLEADALVRQMFEAVVNARVLKRNPSALYLYVAEIDSQMERRIEQDDHVPDGGELPLLTHILGSPALDDRIARVQSNKNKGALRKWDDLKMPERIKLAGLKEDKLYVVYRKLCEGVHTSAVSLPRYMMGARNSTTEPPSIWFGPNWQEAFRSMGAACSLLLMHVGMLSSTFNIGLHGEIIELGKRLELLRNLKDSWQR